MIGMVEIWRLEKRNKGQLLQNIHTLNKCHALNIFWCLLPCMWLLIVTMCNPLTFEAVFLELWILVLCYQEIVNIRNNTMTDRKARLSLKLHFIIEKGRWTENKWLSIYLFLDKWFSKSCSWFCVHSMQRLRPRCCWGHGSNSSRVWMFVCIYHYLSF
jgi:hypothetical protein